MEEGCLRQSDQTEKQSCCQSRAEQNWLLIVNTGKTSKLRGSDLFLITVNPTEPGHKDNNNNDDYNTFSEIF
ncbi:hypothetical protein P5673_030272 [Acropora cervicornis]|uniref:Uncharacterized protein n=1 Tax=Acropora cervicornis TaxID=6130 RepID=A0AAD9PUD5_ACRCE|nr:hypothetical protein P5673_030272 [Acropora cervicornis]